jgi:hypothetical protein
LRDEFALALQLCHLVAGFRPPHRGPWVRPPGSLGGLTPVLVPLFVAALSRPAVLVDEFDAGLPSMDKSARGSKRANRRGHR